MYCDSHAHLTSPEVLPEVDAILERAKAARVDWIVNICTDQKSLEEGLKLGEKYRWVVNTGATTPHDVDRDGERDFPAFEAAASRLVAIGETGLDYHYQHSERTTQRKFLIRYLQLAAKIKKPVIFHCREAFDDLFSIADAEYPKGAPAILHCFTGTIKEAEGVWKRGWALSLSGIVTFKKSEELRLVAKEAPLEQLLIETDTPYLAPQSRRGKPNEPSYIIETAACIAAARNVPVAEVAAATRINALRLFQLSN
ncbi:MAG: TatD family hydrolase [Verrucomicrobiota bacterium]|nr:TatD family hydrolase [Verrucomicrobiota bacterium]